MVLDTLIQALTGSQLIKDKISRSEFVIQLLKRFGLDPDHPPADFEGIYQYALVEYGVGKSKPCLDIFRASEIRDLFRKALAQNNPSLWLQEGESFLEQSPIGQEVRLSGIDPKRELTAFATVFIEVAKRSRTPAEVLTNHNIESLHRTVTAVLERLDRLPTLEGTRTEMARLAAQELRSLPASEKSRTFALAQQLRGWFETLGYQFEKYEQWDESYFEWIIDIPVRRGRYDRTLIRGIEGVAELGDVMALARSHETQRTDEAWLVTTRRISPAARTEISKNEALACYTFDELLDQDADFSGYLDWLESEIQKRQIQAKYVPLACLKEELDPITQQRIAVSCYGESEGWIEGYIDQWLDDPSKEHVSILGEFGTGKTWFILHYAWMALQRYRDAQRRGVERPRLPIVIPLRDYAKAVSVESLFSEFFFRKHEVRSLTYSAFEQLNRMGKLLLMFDGFDEMAARVNRQEMINNFWELAKVVVPGSKVILTCRTEHFPEAKEGRALLNAELQASTKDLTGETPQFEVLELEKFDDEQIRQVLRSQTTESVVAEVLGNPQLLDLARRPVMAELVLEALPDIEAGKPIDMSRVYLYAVRRKMERDIRAERTFTSMADKLYFLCELSWEMLSSDRMSLNYREFPDRIRHLFGAAVQGEKDLDHWHYDMMGQTMLIRNADGDYSPAHRSLLEFFVAYQFAAELGVLAPDFLELAQMKSNVDASLEAQPLKWSDYFQGEFEQTVPLKEFVSEGVEILRSRFGKEPLTKAIQDLLTPMLTKVSQTQHPLFNAIELTRGKTYNEVGYIGGNAATLLVNLNRAILTEQDLAQTVLRGANLTRASLRRANLTETDLYETAFAKTSGGTWSVAISSDNQILVTGDSTGRIYVWNAQNGREISFFKAHRSAIRSLLFIPNTDLVLSAGSDNLIHCWNIKEIQTDRPFKVFAGHANAVMSLALARDGKTLVSGSADRTAKLWDIDTCECLMTFEGHTGWVRTVAYDSDLNLIVSGSKDHTIKVWDTISGTCRMTIAEHAKTVMSVSLNASASRIASGGSDGTLRIWDLETGKCLDHLRGHFSNVTSVRFTQSGSLLASLSSDGSIKLWNPANGECFNTLQGHFDWMHTIVFDESEALLITGSNQEVRVWSTEERRVLVKLNFSKNDIDCVAFHPSRNLIASASADHTAKLWDVEHFKCVETLQGHSGWVSSVAFNTTGKLLATGSHDRTIRLWDVESRQCIKTLIGHTGGVLTLAFGLEDQVLISGSDDSTIRVWDIETGQPQFIFQEANRVPSIAYSASRQLIAAGNANGIATIWNACTGERIYDFQRHEDWVRAIAFNADGNRLATGSSDCVIRIWDVNTETCLHVLRQHEDWINSVAFNPVYDHLIASGSFDCTIRVWDTVGGECLHLLQGHLTPVLSVAFSPDGQHLISSSIDETIKIWHLATATCIATLRDRPYEEMNITGIIGLTEIEKTTLKSLGAIAFGNSEAPAYEEG